MAQITVDLGNMGKHDIEIEFSEIETLTYSEDYKGAKEFFDRMILVDKQRFIKEVSNELNEGE